MAQSFGYSVVGSDAPIHLCFEEDSITPFVRISLPCGSMVNIECTNLEHFIESMEAEDCEPLSRTNTSGSVRQVDGEVKVILKDENVCEMIHCKKEDESHDCHATFNKNNLLENLRKILFQIVPMDDLDLHLRWLSDWRSDQEILYN